MAFRKFISVILCIATLLALAIVPSNAEDTTYTKENGAFIFDSSDSLSYLTGAHSLEITYTDTYKAALLRVNSSSLDPYALIDFDAMGLNLSADTYKYVAISYMVPGSVSSKAISTELFLSAGSISGPTAGKSRTYSITASSEMVYQTVSLSNLSWWTGEIHSIRFDCFCNCSVDDIMYLDSIILCETEADANTALTARRIARNGGVIPEGDDIVIPEDYLCTSYEWDKYTSPFWKGEIVYNEAVYPIKNKQGVAEFTLMYTPEYVLSVYDAQFKTKYIQGLDYTVSGNKITFFGAIPVKSYSYLHNASSSWKRIDGTGYELSTADCAKQYINVTYTHKDSWTGTVPSNSSSKLTKTAKAIQDKGSLNIVYYGDSLCGGARASSYQNLYPYAEWWNQQITTYLKKGCGVDVSATYSSVGGSTSTSMATDDNINQYVIPYAPDIVVVEFGVNDAQNYSAGGDSISALKSEFNSSVKTIINKIRSKYPNCEFLIVTPYYSQTNLWRTEYFDACQQACYDVAADYSTGVAVADVLALHQYLLNMGKAMEDFTGDNLCHPNDYGMRMYSQVCLEAIVPGGVPAYVPEGEITKKTSEEEDPEEPEEHTHAYGDWVIITNASCVAEGLKERVCSCGDKQTEVIPINGVHEEDTPVVTPATCTENGSIVTKCKLCGWSIANVPIKATGHTAGEAVVTPASCTAAGSSVISCTVCKAEISRTAIAPTGHTFVSGVCTKCGAADPDYNVVIKGDVDGNGKVNTTDVNIELGIIIGREEACDAADLNSDNKVNSTDMNELKKIILGIS